MLLLARSGLTELQVTLQLVHEGSHGGANGSADGRPHRWIATGHGSQHRAACGPNGTATQGPLLRRCHGRTPAAQGHYATSQSQG